MKKIWINDGIEGNYLEKLIKKGFVVENTHLDIADLIPYVKGFDVLVVRSATKLDRKALEHLKGSTLKTIIRAGVGLDNIDTQFAKSIAIDVYNTPSASTFAVAELTMGHLINLSRHLIKAHNSLSNSKWEKKSFLGSELYGKIIGIIGMGRIGKEVAKRCHAFGMVVKYYVPSGEKRDLEAYQYVSLDTLASEADYISLHAPYDANKGAIVNEAFLSKVKSNCLIVNASRGKLIDETAVLKALNEGRLRGIALDVFSEEPPMNRSLLTHENVILSPHIGASTHEAQMRVGEEIYQIIMAL